MAPSGPQAPTSLTNGPPFLELQCEWIRDALKAQRENNIDVLEANQAEEDKWRQGCTDMANRTLAVQTNSWYAFLPTTISDMFSLTDLRYMGANVPGKKREYLLYMGGVQNWHAACQAALKDWRGFEVSAAA